MPGIIWLLTQTVVLAAVLSVRLGPRFVVAVAPPYLGFQLLAFFELNLMAREVTTRGLPIATDIAGAHLYLNPGGVREMHGHNSAEWAYILVGHCQVTVVDPEGVTEVANYTPGDLWYFPRGHAHAIQTLGSEACHAVLAKGCPHQQALAGSIRVCSTPDSRHAAEGPAELRSVPLADSCGAAKRPSQIGSISIALLELASARSHDLTLLTKQRESLASYIDRERLRDRGSRT